MDKAQQFSMAKQSALNMVSVAEKSLEEHTSLEKLVLIEYPPRADSVHLAELTDYSNQTLRAAADRSKFRRKIVVGSMDNLKYSSLEEMVDRFGPRNVHPRYDGVHFRGSKGKQIYTNSIVAAVAATANMTVNKQVANNEFRVPRNTVRQQEVRQSEAFPTTNMFTVLN